MIDIVYVTYNSEKWVRKSMESLVNSDFNTKQINVVVVDNASNDGTLKILEEVQSEVINSINSFKIIRNKINAGFGKANNIGFSHCKSEIVCFFNIDTEVLGDTLSMLMHEIDMSDRNVVMWEFRQLPYEHPKMYDPLTGETDWASGAAFAIKRNIYEEVGGFDEQLFMYVEDVDLSWRIRSRGYKIKYVPRVRIYHYSYENGNVLKLNQQVYGLVNNLLLRYRFGTIKDVFIGHLMVCRRLIHKENIPGIRKVIVSAYIKHFSKIIHFYQYGRFKKNKNFIPRFIGTDYTPNRYGAFYESKVPSRDPLVSVIVRTCGRPSVLKETLISLKNQTYSNMEIIVVEDGENQSEQMIRDEFQDINIMYFATQKRVGRSKAGNFAMQKANGKYLNFLDDDDLFFADHIEVLVSELEKSSAKAAYAVGLETAIDVKSKEPYIYEVKNSRTVHHQGFDKIMICHHNYIPIQCIMFEKDLFVQYGGFDENVDALEDWDLWVRYSLYTDFIYIEKTTSIYRVPYSRQANKERQKALDDALVVMREKHKGYERLVDVSTLAKLYEKSQ